MTAITTQIQPTPASISPTLQTINIIQGPSGKKLRRPITILIPEPRSLEEKNLQQYVINAFTAKMPSLIDFTFRNASVLEVAKHLKRHTTGSDATLYQYVYGINRYSRWIRQEPDRLINECKDTEQLSTHLKTKHEYSAKHLKNR